MSESTKQDEVARLAGDIPMELYKEFKKKCIEEGKTITDKLRELVKKFVEQ